MSDKLTTQDQSDIRVVNHELANVERSFKTIGPAVTRIHTRGNWKSVAKNWQEFCEAQGWSRQRMHQIETGWKAVLSLPPAMSTVVDTERAARELAKVPPDARKHVVESVLEAGEKVTSETVKKAATVLDVKPEIVDNTGYKIPKEILPFWEQRHDIQDLMTAVSKSKTRLEKARQEDDPLYRRISQAAIDHLSRAYQYISDAKPYAVCLTCQGRQSAKCPVCKGTGLVCESMYALKEAQEKRIIREKAYHLRPYA